MLFIGKVHGNKCNGDTEYDPFDREVKFAIKSAFCEKVFILPPSEAVALFDLQRDTATLVEQDMWEFFGGKFV